MMKESEVKEWLSDLKSTYTKDRDFRTLLKIRVLERVLNE